MVPYARRGKGEKRLHSRLVWNGGQEGHLFAFGGAAAASGSPASVPGRRRSRAKKNFKEIMQAISFDTLLATVRIGHRPQLYTTLCARSLPARHSLAHSPPPLTSPLTPIAADADANADANQLDCGDGDGDDGCDGGCDGDDDGHGGGI